MKHSIYDKINLFKKAVDPFKRSSFLHETKDGFITNRQWAIRKKLLEGIPYQEHLFAPPIEINCLDIIQQMIENAVKVYENFDYYAVRTEIISNNKKGQVYILDIPELFRKKGILKAYADFIEAVAGNSVRRIYITEEVNELNNSKEIRAYFVWFDANDETQINAICAGLILE
jgi:hypothetical protein